MQKEPGDIRAAVVLAKKFEEIQLATRPRLHNPRVFATQEDKVTSKEASKGGPNLKELYEEITKLRAKQADLENKLSRAEARAQHNPFMDPNHGGGIHLGIAVGVIHLTAKGGVHIPIILIGEGKGEKHDNHRTLMAHQNLNQLRQRQI